MFSSLSENKNESVSSNSSRLGNLEGQTIRIISQHTENPNWWKGFMGKDEVRVLIEKESVREMVEKESVREMVEKEEMMVEKSPTDPGIDLDKAATTIQVWYRSCRDIK